MRNTEQFVGSFVEKCFAEYKAIPGRSYIAYRESTETEDGDVAVLGECAEVPDSYWPSDTIPWGATNEQVRTMLRKTIYRLPIMKYGDLDD